MERAFRRTVQEVGLPMDAAVLAASTSPARALGLDDRTGGVAPGRDADLVVLGQDLELVAVIAAGEWVPDAGPDAVEEGTPPGSCSRSQRSRHE
jgi:N-acetylglucosamine-6-phosphate deacetylase